MSAAAGRLIRYPAERALEHVAFDLGMAPTHLFCFLLPVWRVEVSAVITDAEPYDLIDRYLERGIQQARLGTTAELSAYLGVRERLVDQALRFLAAIEHVSLVDGRLVLTPLGELSVREQRRYVRRHNDRRILYFDGFGSRPLTRPYYDARTVTMLSATELAQAESRFQPVIVTGSLDPLAVPNLAGNRERDRFNLPVRIDDPAPAGAPEPVYLPAYVVRATDHGAPRYLFYSQTDDRGDPDLADIYGRAPDLVGLVENEANARIGEFGAPEITTWLSGRGLSGVRPLEQRGAWHVTLPATAFEPDGPLSITKVGSYVLIGNSFFRVWTTSQRVRRAALLARLDSYLGGRRRPDYDELNVHLNRLTRQLELPEIDLPAAADLARRNGQEALARQLAQLAQRTLEERE